MEKIDKTLEKKLKTSEKPKRKQSSIRWTCSCGIIIRSTRPDVRVRCMDCGERFKRSDENLDDKKKDQQNGDDNV